MLDNVSLGKEIKRIRDKKGLSQTAFAQALGKGKNGQGEVSKWENGERPGRSILEKIIKYAEDNNINANALRTANDSDRDGFRAGLNAAAAIIWDALKEIEDMAVPRVKDQAAKPEEGSKAERAAKRAVQVRKSGARPGRSSTTDPPAKKQRRKRKRPDKDGPPEENAGGE